MTWIVGLVIAGLIVAVIALWLMLRNARLSAQSYWSLADKRLSDLVSFKQRIDPERESLLRDIADWKERYEEQVTLNNKASQRAERAAKILLTHNPELAAGFDRKDSAQPVQG
jgi:predicted MPP superfamily phosphohydrolase